MMKNSKISPACISKGTDKHSQSITRIICPDLTQAYRSSRSPVIRPQSATVYVPASKARRFSADSKKNSQLEMLHQHRQSLVSPTVTDQPCILVKTLIGYEYSPVKFAPNRRSSPHRRRRMSLIPTKPWGLVLGKALNATLRPQKFSTKRDKSALNVMIPRLKTKK